MDTIPQKIKVVYNDCLGESIVFYTFLLNRKHLE